MDNFPIFLDIKNKPILVVGGGEIALRKVFLLNKAAPKITVVAKSFSKDLLDLTMNNKNIHLIKRDFKNSDIDQAQLIIAATDNLKLNQKISKLARKHNILVNVVDQPELCSFTMGSIVERDALVISISSAGKAPVLVRMLREKIEAIIPSFYSLLVEQAGNLRLQIQKKFKSLKKRRLFWESFFENQQIINFLNKDKKVSSYQINKIISHIQKRKIGEVYLVGAGPGERDLLTLRALQLMQKCDVCIYDNLVSSEILELVRRDAEKIYAGKKRDQHTIEQTKINELLVKFAKEGKTVLRLKGGDPFIFGRGGEEIETLMRQKINFQVVPGITAANGVSSYAGIPLTHRDYAQSCLFLTGHLKEGELDYDWSKLIVDQQTLVIYMGLLSLPNLIENLVAQKTSKFLPVAVIESGTLSSQKVVTGNLKNIETKVKKAKIKSPALIIIGQVVKLREKLNWFN
jgi:uroporphyrin-III C-methyltransferase/precorrin-2 dehydrogenase/sirohydrochlorin ferrochelatase